MHPNQPTTPKVLSPGFFVADAWPRAAAKPWQYVDANNRACRFSVAQVVLSAPGGEEFAQFDSAYCPSYNGPHRPIVPILAIRATDPTRGNRPRFGGTVLK